MKLTSAGLACAAALVLALAAGSPAQTIFSEVASEANLTYDQSTAEPIAFVPGGEMSGGAAAGDFDDDGWVDLFVSVLDGPDILYRNLGGSFAPVATNVFAADVQSNGAAWGDIDNDGDLDLYVTAVGGTRHYLYVNHGNDAGGVHLGFSEQAVARNAALADGRVKYGTSAAFGDYNGDGQLDIFAGEFRRNLWPGVDGLPNARLLRNTGNGQFTDTTAASGLASSLNTLADDILGPGVEGEIYAFAPRFVDMDNDGHQDLLLASDFGTTRLFWNDGDGSFTDGTIDALVQPVENGMGSTVGDVDNDGDQDIIATNGWLNPRYQNDQTVLLRNDGDTFVTVAAIDSGVSDTEQGRGLLVFDYDRDGDLDVLIANNGAGPTLYRNNLGHHNKWLQIQTVGTDSNHSAIGAVVTVVPDLSLYDPQDPVAGTFMKSFIDGGSNYLGQNEMIAHFGLGIDGLTGVAGSTVDLVEILWPNGEFQQLFDLAANSRHVLIEPHAETSLPTPGVLPMLAAAIFTLTIRRHRA